MMRNASRREFLGCVGAAALALPAAACARPAVEPAYDLLIAGGRVVDPSQGLAAVRDLAIAGGKVSALEPRHSVPRAGAAGA